MTRKDRIYNVIQKSLSPEGLNVIDDSHQHIGHQGAQPGGETHYRVEISCKELAEKSRVTRERTVTALLKEEFDTGLHALQIIFV